MNLRKRGRLLLGPFLILKEDYRVVKLYINVSILMCMGMDGKYVCYLSEFLRSTYGDL